MSGRTAATVAFWLIRRGFRYVPVTYTGIAFLNFIPYFLRGLRAHAAASRSQRFSMFGKRPQVVRRPSQESCSRTVLQRLGTEANAL
jgi:hypothetical protein